MPRRLITLAFRLRTHEPFYIEVLSGIAAVVWGVYSHLSYLRLEDSPLYRPMTQILAGAYIEAISVLLGLLQLFLLYENRPAHRAACAGVLAMWWAIPAKLILEAETGGPAAMVYGVYGVVGNSVVVWCFAPSLWDAIRQPLPTARVCFGRPAYALCRAGRAGWRRLRGIR